tara:strand:+ start:135 stop:287 length:153 start_codon:yes stop_codon:yes gene_type:complete
MVDGLYQITTPYLCAGFVVRDGHIVDCAPILRGWYWKYKAVLVKEADDER